MTLTREDSSKLRLPGRPHRDELAEERYLCLTRGESSAFPSDWWYGLLAECNYLLPDDNPHRCGALQEGVLRLVAGIDVTMDRATWLASLADSSF